MLDITENTMRLVVDKIPGIKTVFHKDMLLPLEQHDFDVEEFILQQGEHSKLAHFSLGNAESLPFKDGSFDAYVSNFCVHLVDNHKNQLKECFRVIKPGSFATYSVWGRRERTAVFTLFDKCIRELGVDFVEPPRSNFHLGEDPQILVGDMREAGFTNVRYWYQMGNMTYVTMEDYWNFVGAAPTNQAKLKALEEQDPHGVDKLKALLQERWAHLSGQGEFTLFESLIVVCQKPE